MTEEEKKRLGLTGQQPSRSQIVAPNTQAPAVPAAPAQPAAPAPAKQPAAPTQPKPQPLAASTPSQVQANLPGLAVGQQTRGAGAVRLDRQQAPAGKELIGMRSGVPIYADATDVYSNEAAADKAAVSLAEAVRPAANITAGLNKTAANTPAAQYINAVATPASVEDLRKAYQTGPTATAARAQQAPEKKPGEPANAGGFFSKQYADQFTAAQDAANQRAKERIAYGGQPVRDTSNSMAVANNAASTLRNIAAGPKTASMEELKSYGFDKDTEKRLSFGVGQKGENLNVTSDYLKDYAAGQGITKRPGSTFQNPFSGASKPSNRLYRRPGL
jgi:hypothetical protein